MTSMRQESGGAGGQNTALTPHELYRKLPQTNCGRCLVPSCLAFAAAVVKGRKRPEECPYLEAKQVEKLAAGLKSALREPDQAAFLHRLEQKITGLDLAQRAPEIGAEYARGRLTIRSLGKDFHIDHQGKMMSECHNISWVRAPLLSYITNPTHTRVTGDWILFRELGGGIEWQSLFASRCELPLKNLADSHPDLLTDLVELFTGKTTQGFQADIALILHPLPHFPLLICYQQADEDLESDLTIFFDRCCGVNLHIKSIFTLCHGLVIMFDKIARLHLV